MENKLQDANHLLDFATDTFRSELKIQNSKFKIESLWLDGFAEMTPQELDLLAAILPHCENATLAFCLDESGEKENSWLSIWNVVGKSFQQCRQRIENLPVRKLKLKFSPRDSEKNRFAKNSELAWLEVKTGHNRAQNPKPQNPKLRPRRFLRQRRSRGRFRRARNFEIRPRRKPFPRLRRPRPQSGKLSQAARPRIPPLRNPVFSRPPRIRRASPARRTHAQRAPHNYFRLAAKRFVRRAQGRDFVPAEKMKLTGWKTPRSNSAGAAKNGASQSRFQKIQNWKNHSNACAGKFCRRLKISPDNSQN
jgi:hypothetical protein